MKKKKVLIFVQDGVGGAERMSVLIGKSLDKEKYDVNFCLIKRAVKTSIKDFIPEEMDVLSISVGNPIFLMLRMVLLIMKERPDVIFSSVFNLSNKILPFRRLFFRAKVIIRCDNYLYTYNQKQQRMLLKLYPKADTIIAQTEEMRDELLDAGIDKKKVIALHNPIDKQTIDAKLKNVSNPYLDNGLKHFVASGRFAYQKGFDMLVDAFSLVCKERNDCDLYIIGDYEYGNREVYNQVINKTEHAGIQNKVHCIGYQNNPYPYFKYADCFVLSSRWEGLPNVLIEALYLGTPAAAFKCIPIIKRIVSEGNTGFCAEKDSIQSLALAMNKAVNLGRIHSTYKSSEINDFSKLL